MFGTFYLPSDVACQAFAGAASCLIWFSHEDQFGRELAYINNSLSRQSPWGPYPITPLLPALWLWLLAAGLVWLLVSLSLSRPQFGGIVASKNVSFFFSPDESDCMSFHMDPLLCSSVTSAKPWNLSNPCVRCGWHSDYCKVHASCSVESTRTTSVCPKSLINPSKHWSYFPKGPLTMKLMFSCFYKDL